MFNTTERWKRLHDLVDHLDHAIAWEADRDTLEFHFVSQRCFDLLGYTKDEWISMGRGLWSTLVPEQDRAELEAIFKQAQAGLFGQSRCDHRFIHKDGREFWFHTGFSSKGPEHPDRLLYGLSVEITPLKETQLALERSERNFRALFESAPGLYLVLLPDLTIATASDPYLEATMQRREDIIGKHVFDVFPDNPADPDADGTSNLRKSLESVLATKTTHMMPMQKYDVRGPDGRFVEKWWSPVNSPVIGDDGEVAYVIHRAEDVTLLAQDRLRAGKSDVKSDAETLAKISAELFERVHEIQDTNDRLQEALDALKASEARNRNFVEAMPQMAFITDENGDGVFFNRRHYDYFGLSPGDLEAWRRHEPTARHPDDVPKVIEAWSESMRTGTSFQTEYRLKRHDGQWRWHLVRAIPVFDARGKVTNWFGTNTDIHDQKMLQLKSETARESAQLASDAKTYFLANMSHEIRTPLGVIQGYAELLDEKPLDEDGHRMVRTISRNTRQLTEIIGEILDVSKIEAGKLEVEVLQFPLNDLIEDVKSVLSFKAREKGIAFRVVLEGDTPKHLVSDPTRLKQILLNLGGNAIKFTNRGHVEMRLKCSDGTDESCNAFRIVVEDTGIGITPAAREKLFQPFSQADISMTRRYGGTGLGLYISRRLAQALGGDLELTKSEPGKGSCFTLTLNSMASHESRTLRSAHDETERQSSNRRLVDKRILLVEDSPDNQALIRLMLSREGATVEVASNGREGYERALASRFDLVLMDIQMPELDGWEAVTRLRQHGYGGAVVALTAHALTEERERSLEAGFDAYLTKPVDRELMVSTLVKFTNGDGRSFPQESR